MIESWNDYERVPTQEDVRNMSDACLDDIDPTRFDRDVFGWICEEWTRRGLGNIPERQEEMEFQRKNPHLMGILFP